MLTLSLFDSINWIAITTGWAAATSTTTTATTTTIIKDPTWFDYKNPRRIRLFWLKAESIIKEKTRKKKTEMMRWGYATRGAAPGRLVAEPGSKALRRTGIQVICFLSFFLSFWFRMRSGKEEVAVVVVRRHWLTQHTCKNPPGCTWATGEAETKANAAATQSNKKKRRREAAVDYLRFISVQFTPPPYSRPIAAPPTSPASSTSSSTSSSPRPWPLGFNRPPIASFDSFDDAEFPPSHPAPPSRPLTTLKSSSRRIYAYAPL